MVAELTLLGGRYELGRAIGAGGCGTVYVACDQQTGAEVAVKLVPPGFDANRLAERLRHEVAVLQRISSRHVARIYGFGEDEPHGIWLAMELVDGVALSIPALGRALLPHEVLRVSRGLLEGLAAVHASGVVHGDVKPTNILVPYTKDALNSPKLIDFGLARSVPLDVARGLRAGSVAASDLPLFGTVRYMAPELFEGVLPTERSDVYAAGLVLFELLGAGELFSADTSAEQLAARLRHDPVLDDRIPPPLSIVLARMLAVDPGRRYAHAGEALGAIVDLDTAPVDGAGASVRNVDTLVRATESVRTLDMPARSTDPRMGPRFPPRELGSTPLSSFPPLSPMTLTPSLRPVETPRSVRPSPFPARPAAAARLTTLPANGEDALRETLAQLDMSMIDALARRERGNNVGRLARATALILRLELDAAALLIEPLASQSDAARAIGATLLARRARRATRSRVDTDKEQRWLDSVPVELAGLLVCFGVAIAPADDAKRDVWRTGRLIEHVTALALDTDVDRMRRAATLRATLRVAQAVARTRAGELTARAALDAIALALARDGSQDPRGVPNGERIVRSLLIGGLAAGTDDARAREELERAVRGACEVGATLLEVCAATALAEILVRTSTRLEQAVTVVERASTLLARGDAPTLEHQAFQCRGAARIVQGAWSEAVTHFRAARAAATADRAPELELASASLEVLVQLALGHAAQAHEAASMLGVARLGLAPSASLAWVALCLDRLVQGDHEASLDALAQATATARDGGPKTADAFVLSEILSLLFEAAEGALPDLFDVASELERAAQARSFASFYLVDVLRSIIDAVGEPALRVPMSDALGRLALLFGPSGRLARERRTSAPPGPEAED